MAIFVDLLLQSFLASKNDPHGSAQVADFGLHLLPCQKVDSGPMLVEIQGLGSGTELWFQDWGLVGTFSQGLDQVFCSGEFVSQFSLGQHGLSGWLAAKISMLSIDPRQQGATQSVRA